jgi:serine phosphatase RsbU (regulator of sigma subunit)
MANPEQIADLIIAKYSQQHPREFYLHEAKRMRDLLQSELIEVGYMNAGRWRHIADTYAGLGLLPGDFPLDGFLYDTESRRDMSWLYQLLAAAIAFIAIAAGITVYIHRINLRLGKALDEIERENEFAHDVMQRLVRLRLDDPRLAQWSRPALTFSGDVTAAARTPDGRIWTLLADCTGHGLSAALNVVPVVEMFYGMAARGLPLVAACGEMNARLHSLMPSGRFVCAALVEIDPGTQLIAVWNGGMPPVLCVDAAGNTTQAFPSRHMALGIVDADEFVATAESCTYPRNGVLLMCSDGVLEASDAHGRAFGEEGVARLLQGLIGKEPLATLAQREIQAGAYRAHDDVTLLAVSLSF